MRVNSCAGEPLRNLAGFASPLKVKRSGRKIRDTKPAALRKGCACPPRALFFSARREPCGLACLDGRGTTRKCGKIRPRPCRFRPKLADLSVAALGNRATMPCAHRVEFDGNVAQGLGRPVAPARCGSHVDEWCNARPSELRFPLPRIARVREGSTRPSQRLLATRAALTQQRKEPAVRWPATFRARSRRGERRDRRGPGRQRQIFED